MKYVCNTKAVDTCCAVYLHLCCSFLKVCEISRRSHGEELAAGLDGILEVTLHVEGVFWELVTSTFEEGAEAFNGVGHLNEFTWLA